MKFVKILTEFFQSFKTTEMLIIEAWPWARHFPIISNKYRKTKDNMAVVSLSCTGSKIECHLQYFDFITKEVQSLEETFDPSTPATNFVHAYIKEIDENNNATHKSFRYFPAIRGFLDASERLAANNLWSCPPISGWRAWRPRRQRCDGPSCTC